MIFDAHVHIGLPEFVVKPISREKLRRPAFRDRMENAVDSQLKRMDASGVDRAVVFGFPLAEVDRCAANEYVLAAVARHPDRFVPFMLVGDDTQEWLERGARGFKQQDILYDSGRFDLPRAYAVMAEAGVPMLIHFRSVDAEGRSLVEQARGILRHVPDLKLIVGHMGRAEPNTGRGVVEAVRGLAEFPGVSFETSTVRNPQVVAEAARIVGAERILFGSDYPFNSWLDEDPLGIELEQIRSAGLPAEDARAILGGNLGRLLGESA